MVDSSRSMPFWCLSCFNICVNCLDPVSTLLCIAVYLNLLRFCISWQYNRSLLFGSMTTMFEAFLHLSKWCWIYSCWSFFFFFLLWICVLVSSKWVEQWVISNKRTLLCHPLLFCEQSKVPHFFSV